MNRSGKNTASLAIAGTLLLTGSVLSSSEARAQDRQPNVITNQFSTTTGGALNARRPGLIIQQGIAAQQGSLPIVGGPPMPEPFLQETLFIIMQSMFDSILAILDTINLAAGLGGLASLFGLDDGGGTMQMTTVPNPTTTGQGTMTPVP